MAGQQADEPDVDAGSDLGEDVEDDGDRSWVPAQEDNSSSSEGELCVVVSDADEPAPKKQKTPPTTARGGRQQGSTAPGSTGSGRMGRDLQPSGPQPSTAGKVVARTSAVWAFFTCQSQDPSVAVCYLCRQKVRRGQTGSHMGTSALSSDMKRHHRMTWEQHQSGRAPGGSGASCPPPPIPQGTGASSPIPVAREEDSEAHSRRRPLCSSASSAAPSVSSSSLLPSAQPLTRQVSLPQVTCLRRRRSAGPVGRWKGLRGMMRRTCLMRRMKERRTGSQGTVGQQRESAPVVSQPTHPPTSTVTDRKPTSKVSAVWHFFNVCASDRSAVICNECSQKLSLGKPNTHIGTTAMRRHMNAKHKALWEQHLKASYCSTSAVLDPSQPPSTPPSTLTTSSSSASESPPCPGLSVLLARQLLPYQLVDSEAFHKFVAIGTPQWKVPSRNFFSQKGIPHLYQHVQSQVTESLSFSVGAKVHMTTDTWSSKHGQGRYVTYTAHWVNLVMAGKQGMRGSTTVELVSPPRVACGSATTSTPPLIGKVVCDNRSNLLAALRLGNLTHVPCMAHVLNLIVQRFVSKYPGLQDILRQSRKVSGHFRRSYTAMARLADIQRWHNLPVRRLICDSQTRWNSTLLMFERLLQQQRAVNEYLFELGGRTGSAKLGIFFPHYWVLMHDACRLMRPFDEVTNMVSHTEGTISDLVPFVFFLERDVVLDNEEGEMDTSASNLVRMGSFMLSCLLKDPRIKRLKEKDLYWVATLLDPRYKHKVAEMLPTYHKSERMLHFQTSLQNMLYNAFKGDVTPHSRGRGASNPPTSTPARTMHFCHSVTSDMQSFFSPRQRQDPSGSTLRERLDRQVADYLALTADIDTLRSDEPLDYWVRRLDLWPELSQFAINLLSCPASSVLSERTFSAAGGIVTEKRNRLGHKSVDYLTFIKMNEAWISEGYCTPEDLF
uniref:BED-type domain-containing protein n=1 Tax=Xenopus tropicalis TaxID=8364 RepID=A0A803JEL1_XENTR